ncbi:response regulator [Rhizobium leguminosarum]|uniref:response regulator n=1 Tax=Rhizobium leguminosarum TaxID=384 RepID=UPI001C93A413|nr:response regulator [Rhizobium leguminosarum]MBY5410694.1 response regulator [Rhizobium leguminosarum]
MAPRILVVDDEPHIRDVICFALERASLASMAARNGTEAMTAFRRGNIDLIILDVGMPDMDGLEVCRQIRKTSGLPILFLSARDEEIDRVLGLEIGGDDYVTKPFSPRELVARVKAILKRSSNGAEPERRHATLVAGELSLDRRGRTVMFGESTIAMTALEFAILDTLLSRPDMVFSREQLMAAAYGAGTYVADRTIDSHVRNIRAKFLAAGGQGIITTVHGIGFKLGGEIGRTT